MIAISLSKQKAFHADPKAIQQINFTAYLDQAADTITLFIIEEKETILNFSHTKKFNNSPHYIANPCSIYT